MEKPSIVQQIQIGDIRSHRPLSEEITPVETDGSDSGVSTDGHFKIHQQKSFLPKDNNVSDYATGCSSSDASDADNRTEIMIACDRPLDIKRQVNFEKNNMKREAVSPDILHVSPEKDLEDSSHTVTCTVTIAFAIPPLHSKDDNASSSDNKEKTNQKQHKKVEAQRAQRYYHFEYFLLPEDTEPTKVDVIMFGVVAKLYMEQESKILKPWHEQDRIWLLWSHSVELCVTKDLILKALAHQIHVNIWDTKDKVSSKARFDRPKAFRVLQGKQEDNPEEILLNQRKLFEDSQPRPSFIHHKNKNVTRSYQQDASYTGAEQMDMSQKLPPVSSPIPFSSVSSNKTQVRKSITTDYDLGNILSLEKSVGCRSTRKSIVNPADMLDMETLQKFKCNTRWSVKEQKTDAVSSKVRRQSIGTKKNVKALTCALSPQAERRCVTLKLSLMPLLAGDQSITERLQESSTNILDCYMTVALNSALLSEEQKRDLNPIIIRILSATSLPTIPAPICFLKEKCVPVYCRYKFHDQPFHQTQGQKHGTHVYFKDVNVILAGTINPGELREYLRGAPIEIEVHDRDQKKLDYVNKPSLFGSEPEDEKLSNVGLVTSKRTVHNPFTERDKLWDPYGIAKVRLSDVLYGAKYLNICVPIHSCESPDPIRFKSEGKHGKITGELGSVDGPRDSPLSVGHYLDAHSLLKVRVDIPVPLTLESEVSDCPYGRIVYIIDYKNRKLLHEILLMITEINTRALNLDAYPVTIIQDALSKVGLRDDQKEDKSLNVITGIHIMDGTIHLFVLEGLKDNAIKKLWETLPTRAMGTEDGKLEILYNSELSFHERLYKDLGVMLRHIRLHEPLSSIMKQPLLYVRDMVPSLCFQALSRLDYICSAKKLRDVIQSDLLPSVEMINLLSREFGIPITSEDLFAENEQSLTKNLVISEDANKLCFKRSVLHSTLDNYNAQYVQCKRGIESKDYIQNNVEKVYQLGKKIQSPTAEYIGIVPDDGVAVHNYSTQTFNSTERAKRILRQKMSEEPKHRFTYSQDYQSATMDPVDINSELKNCVAKSEREWMTPNGFLYPGFKSSIESNAHPMKPGDALQMALTQAWKENILHANTLQPTLPRDRWRWTQRQVDFDLYSKNPRVFSAPVTIHLAGETLQEEKKKAAQVEYWKWLKNIKVDDLNMKFYRCLPATELASHGPNASTQQSRLLGLIKDKPEKLSLRRADMTLKPIPALPVVQNSGVNVNYSGKNKDQIITDGFVPGEQEYHSLKWNGNIIPCHNREHQKFQHLKGKDFELYSSEHSLIYKRGIKDLNEEDRNAFLMMKRDTAEDQERRTIKVHDTSNIIKNKTYNGFFLNIK